MDDELKRRLEEAKNFLDDNYDDGPHGDDDALEHLSQECGKLDDGSCMYAGSEQCEFECPFR